MATKPSAWALEIWREANRATVEADLAWTFSAMDDAGALVIEQAFEERDAEIRRQSVRSDCGRHVTSADNPDILDVMVNGEVAHCRVCAGTGWVCENHRDQPWEGLAGGKACCGGAGAPCGACNLELASSGYVEQARTQWERELCEWLAEVPWPYRNDALITAISRGEHRKGK